MAKKILKKERLTFEADIREMLADLALIIVLVWPMVYIYYFG